MTNRPTFPLHSKTTNIAIMVRSLPLILGCTAVASAHSWLGCTDQDNKLILEWMKGNATEYKGPGDLYVDTL